MRIFLTCLFPALLSTILFSILSLVMMAVGTTQPLHPAIQGFVQGCENIPQPCWYGIVPGETTDDAAQEIMENLGYRRVNEFFFQSPGSLPCDVVSDEDNFRTTNIVDGIYLDCIPPIPIGDAMGVFGRPRGINILGYGVISVDFGENFTISLNAGTIDNWPTPRTVIQYILLLPEIETSSVQWYGFTTSWRYCQLTNQPTEYCTIR
jgi:hypothetical protein